MFIYKKNLNPNGGRVLMAFTITDSQTLSVGEAVEWASGKVSTAGAGADFLGVVESFVKADGSPVTDNGAGGDFVGTYTAGSSNTVKAMVDVSTDSIYSVALDDTIGITTGSNLAGYHADMTAGSQTLDESTAATTTAQWLLLGPDPDGSAADNSVLCMIFESQLRKTIVS